MDIVLQLRREPPRNQATPGRLRWTLDGATVEYYTLEDGAILYVQNNPYSTLLQAWHATTKVPGQTAIPAGRYRVALTYSGRWKRQMNELLDVPQFTGIRFHGGNRHVDTQGCPLVGVTRVERTGRTEIANCAAAVAAIRALLNLMANRGKVWVEIWDPGACP